MLLEPIPRIQEDAGRGPEIILRIDQLGVLDYWAQASEEALVGVSFQVSGSTIEYWLPILIDPSPDEGSWDSYLEQLKGKWMEKLGNMSPWIAQYFPEYQANCSFRMRYRNNLLRVWFTKEDLKSYNVYPLAEAAIPKDKWISPEAEVMIYLPLDPAEIADTAQALLPGTIQDPPPPHPGNLRGQI
jgi:hypothetical protein